jgi:hypothetical protein
LLTFPGPKKSPTKYMYNFTGISYIRVLLRAESGHNVLILLASCQQTCMTHTIAVCTVKNS